MSIRMDPASTLRMPGLARLSRQAVAFRGAAAGVAAVEFAMVLPVMIAMLLGMTEVTSGVNMDRKLAILSRSLADLSARVPKITTSEMSNIFAAASSVMQPYSSSTTQMVVSSIRVRKVGTAYQGDVQWSCAKNIPPKPAGAPADFGKDNLMAKPVGSAVTVPDGFQTNASFILVETRLPYQPVFGSVLTGTINLGETTPWPVRNVDAVEFTGSCPS